MKTGILTAAFPLLICSTLAARTLHVPIAYKTIQAAIDAAASGDTVLVEAGTYEENIDFLGKPILVLAVQGPAGTVIDGGKKGSVAAFRNGEGPSSRLSGFTLTNGSGTLVGVGSYTFLLGGGVYCDGSSPKIDGNRIVDNRIPDTGTSYGYLGGGLYCENGASPQVEENLFEDNQANGGGGIHCTSRAAPAIRRNTLRHNRCLNYHSPAQLLYGSGAAIACTGLVGQTEEKLYIEENLIEFNSAEQGAGGIRLAQRPKTEIRKNWIHGNGPHSIGCSTLHSVRIEENRITDTLDGHAINCFNSWPGVFILNNQIARSQSGSGIWFNECGGTIAGNVITENVNDYGAGLYLDGDAKVVNNFIAWNEARGPEKGGGGIFVPAYNKGVSIINNTIVGNTAAVNGGGISSPNSGVKVYNNILWDNPGPGGVEIYGDCIVEYCDVKGGWPGPGNIDSEPLFADPGSGDFHITWLSPCRDSGDNDLVPQDVLEDFDGDPRIYLRRVDMGADEWYMEPGH